MTSDVTTIDLHTGSLGTDVSASGAWSENFVQRPEAPWIMGRLVQVAGMVLALTASPATAIPDHWFYQGQRYDPSTAAWSLKAAVGRRISRVEALRTARQILEQAERERAEIADWEAKRGIQWEAGE